MWIFQGARDEAETEFGLKVTQADGSKGVGRTQNTPRLTLRNVPSFKPLALVFYLYSQEQFCMWMPEEQVHFGTSNTAILNE
jgi:hypothetical protein